MLLLFLFYRLRKLRGRKVNERLNNLPKVAQLERGDHIAPPLEDFFPKDGRSRGHKVPICPSYEYFVFISP